MKACEVCGKPTGRTANAKVCGPDCKRKKKRLSDIERRARLKAFAVPVYVPKVDEKACMGCREVLPRSAFGLNRARTDGLQQYCKACRSALARRADQQTKDKERKAVWYKQNRERMAAEARQRYIEKREEYNAQTMAAYKRNREQRLQANKERYQRQKGFIRRVCVCGQGFKVSPHSQRYFCSVLCRVRTRQNVAETLSSALHKLGVALPVEAHDYYFPARAKGRAA